MRNTAWTLIQSGQIVSFRYKSSGRSVQRTVLCLDPEYIYRKKSTGRNVKFFIGLELYASDKPRLPRTTLEQMFKILGKGDLKYQDNRFLKHLKYYGLFSSLFIPKKFKCKLQYAILAAKDDWKHYTTSI